MDKPAAIAVFRALQLGDLLCAVPALRALRAACLDARITLIGLPWAESFAARFHRYIDDFLPFPGYPGMPESTPDLRRIPAFFEAAQARRFDLALQLHGSGGLSNPVVMLLGARRTAGFYRPGDYCPDPARFLPWPEGEHEIRVPLRLLDFLGMPSQGEALEFPLADADQRELATLPEASRLRSGRYLCVHPGARLPSRRWHPERFAQVADALADEGWQIVLTGSADERELVSRVAQAMRMPHVNLAGRTSLGALAALLQGSRLLLANDTGLSHIAAAVRTPSVIVCLGSDPARWAPLDQARHHVVLQPVDCRPCMHAVCPIGHPCADGVTATQVLARIHALLDRPARHPDIRAEARP